MTARTIVAAAVAAALFAVGCTPDVGPLDIDVIDAQPADAAQASSNPAALLHHGNRDTTTVSIPGRLDSAFTLSGDYRHRTDETVRTGTFTIRYGPSASNDAGTTASVRAELDGAEWVTGIAGYSHEGLLVAIPTPDHDTLLWQALHTGLLPWPDGPVHRDAVWQVPLPTGFPAEVTLTRTPTVAEDTWQLVTAARTDEVDLTVRTVGTARSMLPHEVEVGATGIDTDGTLAEVDARATTS